MFTVPLDCVFMPSTAQRPSGSGLAHTCAAFAARTGSVCVPCGTCSTALPLPLPSPSQTSVPGYPAHAWFTAMASRFVTMSHTEAILDESVTSKLSTSGDETTHHAPEVRAGLGDRVSVADLQHIGIRPAARA